MIRQRVAESLRRLDRVSLGAVLVALSPIVVAAARAVRAGWFPIGDSALLYIRAADTFTSHHPWLGSWTSASQSVGRDMNNPGAMYDWLMAPFAHLLAPGPGAAIGVASINAACVVGIAVAARHVGGRGLERVMLLVAALLAWSMGSELLIDIWQAHALLLPFLLLLVLLVGVADRSDRCLPWAVVVSSLLVQTHISYAYILVLLAVAVTALRVAVRRHSGPAGRRPLVVAGGVGVLLWLPSIGEQLFGAGEGNLARLARSAGGGELTLGMRNALGAVAAVFARPWWWWRPGFSTTVPSTPVGTDGGVRTITLTGLPSAAGAALAVTALTAALVAAALALHRRGARTTAVAAAVAACVPPATVLCLSALTVGPAGLAAHHVRWIWAAAAFVHGVCAWAACQIVLPLLRRSSAVRAVSVAWAAALVVVAADTLPVVAHPEGPTADRAANAVLAEVFDSLRPLERLGPVRYDTATLRVFEPYSSAVMMHLQARGIEFRVVDEGMVRQLGDGRRASGDERVVVSQLEGIDAIRYAGPACVLARATWLTDDERVVAEEAATMLETLVAGGIATTSGLERLGGEDRSVVTGAAAGDAEALDAMVYRGVLSRALAAGAIEFTGYDVNELVESAALVDRWVSSTFALLATLEPSECPT